jgi:hypothetical protein
MHQSVKKNFITIKMRGMYVKKKKKKWSPFIYEVLNVGVRLIFGGDSQLRYYFLHLLVWLTFLC